MKKLCVFVTIALPDGIIEQARAIARVEPAIATFTNALTESGCEFSAPIEVVTVREKKAPAPASDASSESEHTPRSKRHAA